MAGQKGTLSSVYYKHLHDPVDQTQVTSWYIKYVDLLLKSHGITKILHTSPPEENQLSELIPDSITWWEENISKHKIDTAQDNRHPGPQSQTAYSDAWTRAQHPQTCHTTRTASISRA